MRISVYSHGTTVIDADGEYQEPAIREAIEDGCNDVASTIIDYTDTERSDISHDEYAIVTEDNGTELWRGWITGDPDALAPAEAPAVLTAGGHAKCMVTVGSDDDPDDEDGAHECAELSRFLVERSDGDKRYGEHGGSADACEKHLAEVVAGMTDGDTGVRALVSIRWDARTNGTYSARDAQDAQTLHDSPGSDL